jgi:hypothetical protein
MDNSDLLGIAKMFSDSECILYEKDEEDHHNSIEGKNPWRGTVGLRRDACGGYALYRDWHLVFCDIRNGDIQVHCGNFWHGACLSIDSGNETEVSKKMWDEPPMVSIVFRKCDFLKIEKIINFIIDTYI